MAFRIFVNTNQVDDGYFWVKTKMSESSFLANLNYGKRNHLNNKIFSGTGYSSELASALQAAEAASKRAAMVIIAIDNTGRAYKECEINLGKSFDNMDELTTRMENEIRSYLGMDQISTIEGQHMKNIGKVVIGVAVITAGAIAVVATGGAVAPFLVVAVTTTACSAIFSSIEAALKGESIEDAFADGFLRGAIKGTAKGFFGSLGKGVEYIFAGELTGNFGNTLVDAAEGKEITAKDVLNDVGAAAFSTTVSVISDKFADKSKYNTRINQADILRKNAISMNARPEIMDKFGQYAKKNLVKKVVLKNTIESGTKVVAKTITSKGKPEKVISEDVSDYVSGVIIDYGEKTGFSSASAFYVGK